MKEPVPLALLAPVEALPYGGWRTTRRMAELPRVRSLDEATIAFK